MQAITSLFTVKPVTRRPKVAKRGSLQVVAHGGVGGSGGPQYPGKDKPYGSDQAPWKKKLILHDDDQADPDANQRGYMGGGGGGGGGYSAPKPSYGGSTGGGYAAAKPQRVTRGSDGVVYDPDQYDPDANQRSR